MILHHQRTLVLAVATLVVLAGSASAAPPHSPAVAPVLGSAISGSAEGDETLRPTHALAAADQPERRRRRRPPTAPPPTPRLTVAKVEMLAANIAPDDPLWEDAAPMDVALQPQTTTSPMLEIATVETVTAAALTDGEQIAWRFSWADSNPAMQAETGQFSDAVGVQFPLVPGAPYLMGAKDMPVYSLYWRAQWQQDIDEGFQDVLAVYPNAWSDVYWFGNGHPYTISDSFQDERSRPWFIGVSAGNPMSHLDRKTPVEEVMAEGFGTLTTVPEGIADGRGVWADGYWHVVITRPLTDDALSQLFAPGSTSEFAMAVWDGSAGNVGGRKHHSLWVQFEVEQ